MVVSGGAVASACKEISKRLQRIGAALLQTDESEVELQDGRVVGPGGSVTIAEIGRTWYLKPQDLPENVDASGLEVTAGYKPDRDTGTFSYAAHAAVVAVDTETGVVEIIDYAVVEDGGVLVNPMIVDGQVYGGTGQGIGTALYEEMPFSADGQPLAPTLADYLLPGATEVPDIRIDHMETPSPYTEFGQKGIGEGGAIGPPAAIANAINDALADMGVEVSELPITPRRLLAEIEAARSQAASS
jgi:carbon-monoxide dehydrogenase large subunit